MISKLILFTAVVSTASTRWPRQRLARFGLPIANDNSSGNSDTLSSDYAPSNASTVAPEDYSPLPLEEIWGADNLLNEKSQDDAEKFFTARNSKDGNFFGSTIIVDLDKGVDSSNKQIADTIKSFRKEIGDKIKGSERFFDFQENPHMTVSAVIMDRDVKKAADNKKFEEASTNVEAIEKAMQEIENRNVTLKVDQQKALQISNLEGQFSIQFASGPEDQKANTTSDLDIEKIQKQIKSDLLLRIENETDFSRIESLAVRAQKGISQLEKFKKNEETATEFQKVRFELIEKAGADVKDHYPAMCLHIGQIRDPEALRSSEQLSEVNRIFNKYKREFANSKIVMKGLRYVRYTANSLKPNKIEFVTSQPKKSMKVVDSLNNHKLFLKNKKL